MKNSSYEKILENSGSGVLSLDAITATSGGVKIGPGNPEAPNNTSRKLPVGKKIASVETPLKNKAYKS